MSRAEIRGLTLWRPWVWSIVHASKRIENRPWAPPRSIIGQFVALHAGKHWDYDGATRIVQVHPEMPRTADLHPVGIVGVARVVDVITSASSGLPKSQWHWYFGPFGWLLEEVIALPKPVPCRGAQGLWPLPPNVLDAVRAQWKAGHHG